MPYPLDFGFKLCSLFVGLFAEVSLQQFLYQLLPAALEQTVNLLKKQNFKKKKKKQNFLLHVFLKMFFYNTDLPFLLSPLSCLSHPSHFTDTLLLRNDILLLRGSRDNAYLDLNHSSDIL